jgi:hypothetical protein
MTPATKFNALLTGLTVFLMFWLVTTLAPLIRNVSWLSTSMISLTTLLSSAGFFRLLSMGLSWLMSKSHKVRKFVLGPSYIHGTWVGCFTGHRGDKRYMVEHFAQDLDKLRITGRSFTDQLEQHGHWTSEAVTVDVEHGKLVFTYCFEGITKSAPLPGVHTSTLDRQSQFHAPTALGGFAHDMNDATRIPIYSERFSDDLLPFFEAAKEAKKRFP